MKYGVISLVLCNSTRLRLVTILMLLVKYLIIFHERRFFKCVRSVSKIIDKFPFNNNTIKQLAFLDPRNRDKTSNNGIIQLASRFITFSPDEKDTLSLEFRDYRASASDQLPAFDLSTHYH